MKKFDITFYIPSDVHHVSLVGPLFNTLSREMGFNAAQSSQVELCVVEAANNCVLHAYKKRKNQEIELLFQYSNQTLKIKVCDWGTPMDQALIRKSRSHPDSFIKDPTRDHGRGLFIMRKIMDSLSYRSRQGKNTLCMTKNRL